MDEYRISFNMREGWFRLLDKYFVGKSAQITRNNSNYGFLGDLSYLWLKECAEQFDKGSVPGEAGVKQDILIVKVGATGIRKETSIVLTNTIDVHTDIHEILSHVFFNLNDGFHLTGTSFSYPIIHYQWNASFKIWKNHFEKTEGRSWDEPILKIKTCNHTLANICARCVVNLPPVYTDELAHQLAKLQM